MSDSSLKHLAIILDGNRRWAQEHGLPSLEGHRVGYERIKDVGDWCMARGIEILTVFAFSTENWKRTQEEVGYLMDLLERALTEELASYHAKGMRLKVLGRREGLRPSIVRAIAQAEELTQNNNACTLAICLNYGGRAEMVDACRRAIADGLTADTLTEEELTSRLYWPNMPAPDLLIRTSGEQRLSGFLLWECAYSELYWCQKHWPDFSEADLDIALAEFASRQRRFGQ